MEGYNPPFLLPLISNIYIMNKNATRISFANVMLKLEE